MKNNLFWAISLGICALLYLGNGCKTTQATTTKSEGGKTSVSVQINYTSQYCGGAAPTPQILERLNQPQPLENTELLLKVYSESIKSQPLLMTIVTDEKGVANFSITEGKYALIRKEKSEDYAKNPSLASFARSSRCTTWQNTPDGIFEVKGKNPISLELKLYQDCNPCLPPRP